MLHHHDHDDDRAETWIVTATETLLLLALFAMLFVLAGFYQAMIAPFPV